MSHLLILISIFVYKKNKKGRITLNTVHCVKDYNFYFYFIIIIKNINSMSSRSLLLLLSIFVLLSFTFGNSIEFELDNEGDAIQQFAIELNESEQQESETDEALRNEDMALLEVEAQEDNYVASTKELSAEEAEAILEEDISALEVGGEDEEKPEHPTYVLPYPPVLPGHYTPLFNPYTNVNPLSTPFANYAATPGAHPGVAAAAAAQAGSLAAVNGQIAGAAGGYPYYPYAARNPVIAGQLTGNPVPFSGYAGWIHPQNLNSAAVGENEGEEFPQFVEVQTEETEESTCNGCVFN
jgi:hypothetical protein